MAGYGDKSDVVASSFLNRAPDQAAYVVHDLRAGLESWAKKMGVPDWVGWDYDGSYLPKRFYAGEPAEYRSLVAIPTYGPKVEIIQPITGPSVFTTYLEDRGPGLHHLGYFVPDMSEVREWFAARGVAEIMSGGGQGVDGDGEFTYFDTYAEFGSFVEFIQVPERRYDPHFSYHFDV